MHVLAFVCVLAHLRSLNRVQYLLPPNFWELVVDTSAFHRFQQVSAKNKDVLLHNHSTNNVLG